ncbi:Uncharacterised protein [Bordetella pertussis]|nr:Uncharacterised protein [Bordetella pertussis]
MWARLAMNAGLPSAHWPDTACSMRCVCSRDRPSCSRRR